MKKISQDYESVITTDEKGREKTTVVYRGDYFEIGIDKAEYLRYRSASLRLLFLIIFLHFTAGFVPSAGMYQIYVVLPYVVAYLPLYYFGMGVFRLPKEKREMQRDEVDFSFERIKNSNRFLVGLLALGVLGEIIFMALFDFNGQWPLDALYLALEILTTIAAYVLLRLQQQIEIQSVNEQESE